MEFRNKKGFFMNDLMYQKASLNFRFCHLPDMQISASDLPYQGDKLSMLILLPIAVDGLDDVEKELSERFLNGVISLIEQKVEVSLPKFKIKLFVEVNDEGSEAAAAIAVQIEKFSLNITPEFRANHPFLFYIRDSVNDVILFAGRFFQPMEVLGEIDKRTTKVMFHTYILLIVLCFVCVDDKFIVMATSKPFKNKETASAFCNANKAFMLSLLKQFPQKSNVFYSPFSISTALAMVHLGARTDTLKEMDHVLHFDKMGKDVHSAFGEYLEYLSKKSGNIILKTANKIYQNARFKPEETFMKECEKHFKAAAESMDFSQSAVASSKINSWVSQQTENKIQNLVPADALDASTVMVLINAIYFKGNWESQFQSKNTQKMEFRNEKGNFMTDMMYQRDSFRFCHLPDMKISAIDLPYQGDKLSMLILLPIAVDGLDDVEKKLSERFLNGVISHLKEQKVEVYLPKFKMESTFKLKPHLSALGMSSAFDENKADFSGMDKGRNVYIGEVFHKAFVEVNEEGSEAAVAIAVVMDCSMNITPEFRANHPFLFFIRDSVNDVILFAGRFFQPMEVLGKEEL